MQVRNTSDRYACLELGILVRPVFKNILLLACSLKNGFTIENNLLAFQLWFKSKPFAYLLACLKDGLIIQNHLLICFFEIWLYNLKPLLAKFLACFSNMVE